MAVYTSNPMLGDRFARALFFAHEAHRLQVRKNIRRGTNQEFSPIPYMSHLLMVSGIVLEYGGNEDEAIAALLHDVVEDTDTGLEEVGDRFGDSVKDLVRLMTKPEEMSGWESKKAHVDQLLQQGDSRHWLVFCADKLANCRSYTNEAEAGNILSPLDFIYQVEYFLNRLNTESSESSPIRHICQTLSREVWHLLDEIS